MKFIAPARVAVIAIAGAVALAGCSYVNPIITQKPYAAADGLQAQIGDVHASNLLIVTTAVDEPASLTGSLYNAGDEDATIVFALDGAHGVDVLVPAKTQVSMAVDGDVPVLAYAPVAPGLIADVAIQSEVTGVITTPVPVVNGDQEEFQPELEALAEADVPAYDA
ncbi:hypothetical protein [Demequina aurantiaca]|uniref:hypothetical protein n=1 Tax=Demequina aurantiaca TaxID=676200 RepID=UPI000782A6EA|nr:hypothetical protein [Demequina aurantiaca]